MERFVEEIKYRTKKNFLADSKRLKERRKKQINNIKTQTQ